MRLARAISSASRLDTVSSFFAMGATRHHRPFEGRWGRGKHIDGGMMCDGWPAGPAPLGMLSRCSRTSERDHLARIRLDLGAVRGPGVHQLAAFVEQIAAPV